MAEHIDRVEEQRQLANRLADIGVELIDAGMSGDYRRMRELAEPCRVALNDLRCARG